MLSLRLPRNTLVFDASLLRACNLRGLRKHLAVDFAVLLLAAGCATPSGATPASSGRTGVPRTTPTFNVSQATVQSAATESAAPTDDPFTTARFNMVEFSIEALGVHDADVLRAMRAVPRHLFVPADYLNQAYENHPLPIGYGQTISQPYIVGWMTELLGLRPGDKVLEIGTGSGYQAAVLAELGYVDVYSVEIIPELAEQAAARLKSLGYSHVHIKQGDGYFGWEEYAPFNAILVTAAPDHLPLPLVQQLADEGRVVIPIGPPGGYQSLWKFVKDGQDLKAYNLGEVVFVPFTGQGIEREPAATAAP